MVNNRKMKRKMLLLDTMNTPMDSLKGNGLRESALPDVGI